MEQGTVTGPYFIEHQKFRQRWLWFILAAMTVFLAYMLIQQVVMGRPFGNNPAPDYVVVILFFIFGVGFPVLFYIMTLTTEVRGDGIYIRLFPLHMGFHRISLGELKTFEARTYNALSEYGGWGIRYGPSGKAYNISGNRGVQLELASGERILIGSQKAEELVSAIGIALEVSRRREAFRRNSGRAEG